MVSSAFEDGRIGLHFCLGDGVELVMCLDLLPELAPTQALPTSRAALSPWSSCSVVVAACGARVR